MQVYMLILKKNIINAANHIYSSTRIHPQMKVV